MSTDQTLQSIDDVLAANEQHLVPLDPNRPELHWRDITGVADPRPVPTTEDRMRDARTDTSDRSFAAYLTAQERDQLDAKAACAQQERDEALDDRDAYKEARDVLRRQLDDERRRSTAKTALLRANRTLLDRLRELGELTDRAWAEHDTNADREYAALSFTDAVCDTCHLLKIDHTNGPCQPGLGSPSPRAQDQPGRRSETGCMGDPDTELRLAGVHPDQEAARRQGYADAIAALRDDSRYMAWWSSTGVKPAGTVRQVLAAYLETVGPDGPDVTKPMPEREG